MTGWAVAVAGLGLDPPGPVAVFWLAVEPHAPLRDAPPAAVPPQPDRVPHPTHDTNTRSSDQATDLL